MFRILLISLLFITNAYAIQGDWICIATKAPSLHKQVLRMGFDDKVKHCTFSCAIANDCGAYTTMQLGLLKEIIDLLGYGTPELQDIRANVEGIRFAYSGLAKNYEECAQECRKLYNY